MAEQKTATPQAADDYMFHWQEWILTSARTAIHRPTRTAVAADLHLGYDRVRRRGGEAIPLLPLEEQLAPLTQVLAQCSVERLVLAGDLFEAGPQKELSQALLSWFERTRIGALQLLAGNHDRGLKGFPAPLVAEAPVLVGDWQVIHGDGSRPGGRVVQGHLHPALCVGSLMLPCYLCREDHLVLPAWSRDARGVDIRGQDCWAGYRCVAIAGSEVRDLGLVEGLGANRRRH